MGKTCAGLAAAVLCPLALISASLNRTDAPPVRLSDFVQAIRANKLSELQKLASSAAAANVQDKLKSTPLHYAVIYGSPEAVRTLLRAGADPKIRNQGGATPLIYGAWNFDITKLLVENGAAVNAAASDGSTALMVASSVHGNIRTVRYLIEKGADVRMLDKLHRDALNRASLDSDPEILRLLLAHGADPHLGDGAGFTALHGAVAFPDCERVRLLLDAGADPNRFNTFAGKVRKGNIALIHLSPLMLAAPYSDGETMTALLKAGARVNEVDIRKMNALMLSIATDHASPATVKQLIASGADVNAKDQTGESVLTWARKFRNPEILSALTAAGAQGAELTAAPQPEPGSRAASVSEAMGRAMPLLAKSGPQFFREGGCSGCHHQPIHARVFAAAARAGLQPDPGLRKNFLDGMMVVRPTVAPGLPVLLGPGGDYDTLLAYMTAFADLAEPANDFTDLLVHYIAVRQDPSGAWVSFGIARPPVEDSSISRTAMAVRVLASYGWPARQAEFAERVRRARAWLQKARPVTTYEQADRIAGLRAAGMPASELRAGAQALIQLQRVDGGWAQTRYLDSDAYATGLVLHTLYTAGLASPQDDSYRRGVEFLLRTQFRDGSWYVRSRAPKFQPYFQSGFPFDHDQWISSAATSLALMALAPASGPVAVADARVQR